MYISIARKVLSLCRDYLIIFHCIWSGFLIAAVPLLVVMVVVVCAHIKCVRTSVFGGQSRVEVT